MSEKKALLLVDDDDLVLALLASRLEATGCYVVATACSGMQALACATARPPDLIVSDVDMPGMDGWTLAKALRSKPRLAFTPFVFLTSLGSPDDALLGYTLGADDYIDKACAREELLPRLAKVFERRAALQPLLDQAGAAAFSGGIETLGLASVLGLLEARRKTGLLELQGPGGQRARLRLRGGSVVAGERVGAAGLSDAHLVYQVLTWSRGSFAFLEAPVEEPDRVSRSVMELLLEAARRQDEARGAVPLPADWNP